MEKYCPKCFKKFPASLKECPADGTNLVSFEVQNLTGRVLDKRYTVLERIGRGGIPHVRICGGVASRRDMANPKRARQRKRRTQPRVSLNRDLGAPYPDCP